MSATQRPIPSSARIEVLDLLRGLAVLGIFLMNGPSFAMPLAAYFNPLAYGGSDALNLSIQGALHLLVDQKFMALFSMLFGASTLLILDRRKEKGLPGGRFYFFRNFWLLLIGIAHALLLWGGDILSIYAGCAFVLYFFRKLPPRWSIGLGLLCFLSPGLLYLNLSTEFFDGIEGLDDFWNASGESLQASMRIFRGNYSDQLAYRSDASQQFGSTQPIEIVAMMLFDIPFRAFGMMLVGMGLFRSGILRGERSTAYYRRLATTTLSAGALLSGVGLALQWSHNWSAQWALGPGRLANLVATPLLAVGYVALVVLWMQSGKHPSSRQALERVGQMALSNYIGQSLLASTIFYGFGLGLYGRVHRIEILAITALIFAIQIAFSKLWMKRFRYGPLEWIWRSLSYLRPQPLGRTPLEEPPQRPVR